MAKDPMERLISRLARTFGDEGRRRPVFRMCAGNEVSDNETSVMSIKDALYFSILKKIDEHGKIFCSGNGEAPK